MEHLIELVAASFARHGIVCAQDPGAGGHGTVPELVEAKPRHPSMPIAAVLPEHNYREMAQGDPSP
jgi:hypothetical protein